MKIETVATPGSSVANDGGDELLTGDELCQRLRVKQSFLYSPSRRKGPDAIPCLRVGKYLRYELGAVKGWISKQNAGEGR